MFLESEINLLGRTLIKKAGLEGILRFSICAPDGMNDANAFDGNKRVIYSIPERNFYEFKALQPLFDEKFGASAATFLEIQKITIAHEIGHALQTNLHETTEQLAYMKSPDRLADIGSYDELTEHANTYRDMLVEIETEAWDLGWALIQENTNKELYERIRSHALASYKEGDMICEESAFFEVHQYIESEKNMDLIGFKEDEISEMVDVKWIVDFIPFRGALTRDGAMYTWRKETIKQYDSLAKKWVNIPSSFDLTPFSFVIDDLQQQLQEIR